MHKKTKIVLIVFILSLIIGITGASYFAVKQSKKTEIDFIVLEKTALVQQISVTGTVKPLSKVNLSFEKSGKVAGAFVKVGDKVEAGRLLVSLNTSELKAQLNQYQATLKKEQAELEELKKGATPEEVQVVRAKVVKAEQELLDKQIELEDVKSKAAVDLANDYDDVEDIIQEAYTTAEDSVNKQVDDLFTNDSTENPALTFSTTDSAEENKAEAQRVSAGKALNNLKTIVNNLIDDQQILDNALISTEQELGIIRDFLVQLSKAVNIAAGITQTTQNTYKGYVLTARENINTAISNINNQKQTIASQKATDQKNISIAQTAVNTAENALNLAKDELNLKLAGSTKEQIQAQEAQVETANANIENTQAQIAKMTLYSPISGIITKQEAKIGEIAPANTTLVEIMSENNFIIETNIPEIDIAKIKIKDPADITFDALGAELVFQAFVSAINPAETIVEGVATYKTTLQFTEKDIRVRPGMTANIDILTAQKNNVLVVPQRTIIQKNGQKFVRLLKNGQRIEEAPVETGLTGSDGNIEIVSGLKQGDKVITFMEE